MPAAPPETIRQYRVEGTLGEGAGGVVYRAFDTHLRRTVVVKLLHRGGAGDPTARLLEEARLASSIDHPNVCAVYEAGEVGGRPYLVMQYVPGRTLQDLLADGPLSEPLALSLGVQVADGLAAAHRHGVLHRDLKPSNVMVTDEGLAKVLDFGLARRTSPGPDAPAVPAGGAGRSGDIVSSRFGTTAYMAPEQFATRRSTEQSDVWALGVILYQMATGQHPFWAPSMDQGRLSAAIQSTVAPDPLAARPDLDPAFASVVRKALARQPEDRYRYVGEVRDALRTVARAVDPDLAAPAPASGEAPVPAPPPDGEAPGRGGLLSALAGRLLPTRTAAPPNAVAVLPFEDVGEAPAPPYVGFALADAVATRLAQAPALLVRPPRTLRSARRPAADPVEAGRQLAASFVLTGQFARADAGFLLTWSLLAVDDAAVAEGGAVEVETGDLVEAQRRLGDEVYGALQASGALPIAVLPQFRPAAVDEAALDGDLAEDYLAARALLDSQATQSSPHGHLVEAVEAFERVAEAAPDFAPAQASLGVALTRYVRYGYGGVGHLLAAQRHLERGLALDASNIEAKLYQAYTLLWRGEKERARQDVQYLLRTAGGDAEVRVGAGVVLQLDGLLGEALATLGTALRLSPTLGPRVYNLRARIRLYRQEPGEARREIERGLAVAPGHTLLRTTDAVWHLRHGDRGWATGRLEDVVADDPDLRLAHPTLAIAYHQAGEPGRAADLVTDDLLALSAADCEMAYRVATYFAVAGDDGAALHWLRKAVHLGNHNAPWLTTNPFWAPLLDRDADVRAVLRDLGATQAALHGRWRRALGDGR